MVGEQINNWYWEDWQSTLRGSMINSQHVVLIVDPGEGWIDNQHWEDQQSTLGSMIDGQHVVSIIDLGGRLMIDIERINNEHCGINDQQSTLCVNHQSREADQQSTLRESTLRGSMVNGQHCAKHWFGEGDTDQQLTLRGSAINTEGINDWWPTLCRLSIHGGGGRSGIHNQHGEDQQSTFTVHINRQTPMCWSFGGGGLSRPTISVWSMGLHLVSVINIS